MKSRILFGVVILACSAAHAGDIGVAGFNLAENREIEAKASKNANPLSKTVDVSLKDGSRECSVTLKFKPVAAATTGVVNNGPSYVNNKPVGASTSTVSGFTVSGFGAKSRMTCNDQTALLCEFASGTKVAETFDGVCASPDRSVAYRVVAVE